jgi:hypothetical protein
MTTRTSTGKCTRTQRAAAAVVVVGAILAVGCGGGSASPDTLAPDAGATGAWALSTADTGKESPAVVLELDSIDGDSVWLSVVARGVSKLQGVAFRLVTDPAAVKFVKAEAGKAWTTTGVTKTAKFAAQKDGEIWGGVGHLGAHGIDASKATTVARVNLSLTGAGPLAVSFREQRNLVLDSTGAKVKTTWIGGTLARVNAE